LHTLNSSRKYSRDGARFFTKFQTWELHLARRISFLLTAVAVGIPFSKAQSKSWRAIPALGESLCNDRLFHHANSWSRAVRANPGLILAGHASVQPHLSRHWYTHKAKLDEPEAARSGEGIFAFDVACPAQPEFTDGAQSRL
jgi:hypothetical protein